MIEFLELVVLGFLAAVLGVSLPGLLNMTAVKISKSEGKKSAYTYIAGASVTIAVQTYLALFCARIIDSNPFVSTILKEIGVGIFAVLTIYFLFFAKRREKKKKIKKEDTKANENKFIYGMFLAALNVFPIPFYVVLSMTLASYDLPIFTSPYTSAFTLGVVVGSALMFYCYVKFFKKPSREDSFLLNNINYCIGAVTGLVTVITLYNMFA